MSTCTAALQPNATEFKVHHRAFSSPEAAVFPHTGYLDTYVQLLEGIRQHRGLLVLTGAAGTGKTLLLRKLIHEATATLKFVFCYSTNLDFDNLLTLICDQLQCITHGWESPPKLAALQEYLNTCFEQGINVALLIDEAHHLSQDVLSPLLTLTQLGLKEGHRVQLVLSGLPVLEEILVQQQALHPHIANAVHVHLEPLRAADVTAFIYRQLQSADGQPPENRLPVAVLDRIARYTGGIPRLITMLCERALWLAQLNGHSTVSTEIIDEAASELMLQERATVQELESRLFHSGNEKVILPRKNRWTVLGAALLALLALAAQVWFPLDRQQGAAEEARRKATEQVKHHAAARGPAKAANRRQATADRQRSPQRFIASQAPTAPVDKSRELILSIFPRED